LGAKNEVWIIPPVDTDQIQDAPIDLTGKIRFAHYPSKVEVKGSEAINATMATLLKDRELEDRIEYVFDPEIKPWAENIQRMSECDVYIETMQPELGGKAFGEWGLTAMEAAALARVVISNHTTKELYEDHFGVCPIFQANTPDQLSEAVIAITRTHKSALRQLHNRTLKWVKKNHSMQAVGKQLKAVFEPCL